MGEAQGARTYPQKEGPEQGDSQPGPTAGSDDMNYPDASIHFYGTWAALALIGTITGYIIGRIESTIKQRGGGPMGYRSCIRWVGGQVTRVNHKTANEADAALRDCEDEWGMEIEATWIEAI